jgi:ATP-binding cassette subfamily B protein
MSDQVGDGDTERAAVFTQRVRRGAVGTIRAGFEQAPALSRGLLLTFVLAVVGAAGRVTIPVLLQQSIDRGITSSGVRLGFVTKLGAAAALIVVVAAVAQRAAVFRLGSRAEEGLYSLRVRLFDHIHRLSLADHNEEKRGALVSRVTSDIETLTTFFAWGALSWLLNLSLMVVVASVMLAYDWVLAIVVFAVVAPLLYVLRYLQRRLVREYDNVRRENAEMLSAIGEAVSGVETLQAYDAIEVQKAKVAVKTKERARTSIRAGIIGAFLFPSGEVFSVFAVVAVVGVGVSRGAQAGLSSGALIGFLFLTYRFLEPIAEFTEIIDHTQTAVAGLRRVLGVLDTPIGPPPAMHPVSLPDGTLDIRFENVSFAYPSRESGYLEDPILSDLSFAIPAGTNVALVGESGSGKTTIARLVARLVDPTAGRITLGGVDLTKVNNDQLRRRLTVVPQEPFLFAGTIADNLRFIDDTASDEELRQLFEVLDCGDWFDSLPAGLRTPVGQRGSGLSAGERQLVALIRASMVDPDVLILDEATSSVDPVTEMRLSRALGRLSQGRTTISIAHRLSTAARADRVLLVENGRISGDGSHANLLAGNLDYRRMYDAWVRATESRGR